MAAVAAIKTPTEAILERLPVRSTSGFKKEDILKLVKIIDSYHDFKVSPRLKAGIFGKDNNGVAEAAASLEAERGSSSPVSKTQGTEFQAILNNYLKHLTGLTDEVFFKSNGVTKSSPEASGRLFFEKECGSILHASPTLGCVPTKAKCSTFDHTKLLSDDAIVLEKDEDFDENDVEKNKAMGQKLLEWFFPEKEGKGGIGFSFDAQAAIIKDFMQPLNNNGAGGGFYAIQVVTPQNILDSASTSYYVLNDKAKKFITLSDKTTGRTEYTAPTKQEFSNLFTENVGSFSINTTPAYDASKGSYSQDFQWQFNINPIVPGDAVESITLNMEGGSRNTGPSVTFLASLIYCWLRSQAGKDASAAALGACWQQKEANNNRMVSPIPVIESLKAKARHNLIPRLLFDIKRLGDHEQANAVYYYNNTPGNALSAIFVTGDILSALYSRLLGNPTIYIRAAGGDAEDDDDPSSLSCPYLMCYRGTKLETDPVAKEQNAIKNVLSQLNYYLSTITTFLSLAGNDDFQTLLDNLETHKAATPFVGENSALKNLLLQTKVKNTIDFLNGFSKNDTAASRAIYAKVTNELIPSLAKKINSITPASMKADGLNIGLNTGLKKGGQPLTLDQLKAVNKILTDGVNALEPKMNTLSVYLQHFNKVKYQPVAGDDSIFAFRNQLFFSESKVQETLDTISYKKEDIDNIVGAVAPLARGMRSNQEKLGKERLQNRCYEFINSFFTTANFEKSPFLLMLQKVVDSSTSENVNKSVSELFTLIKNLPAIEVAEAEAVPAPAAGSVAEALTPVVAATIERDLAIAESQNTAAAAADAATAAGRAYTPPFENATVAAAAVEATEKSSAQEEAVEAAIKIILPNLKKAISAQPPARRGQASPIRLVRSAPAGAAKERAAAMARLATLRSALKGVKLVSLPNSVKRGGAINKTNSVKQKLMLDLLGGMTDLINKVSAHNNNALVALPTSTQKQRKTRKSTNIKLSKTRKVGGDYISYFYGIGSRFDSLNQAKLANDFFATLSTLAEPPIKLDLANLVECRNKIRDKWYNFKALLDAKGTPDLADVTKATYYSYDIRMLKTYVNFTNAAFTASVDTVAKLKTFLQNEYPLGGNLTSPLTEAGVRDYLDPDETLRIGTNNILAYTTLIEKNKTERDAYGADAKYTGSKSLCEYNISTLQLHIESTIRLIELVGKAVPENLEYTQGASNYYEADPAERPENMLYDKDASALAKRLVFEEQAPAAAAAKPGKKKGGMRKTRRFLKRN